MKKISLKICQESKIFYWYYHSKNIAFKYLNIILNLFYEKSSVLALRFPRKKNMDELGFQKITENKMKMSYFVKTQC